MLFFCFKKHIILIVNQLKFGVELVKDTDEKDDFARMFLKAAKEAANARYIERTQARIEAANDSGDPEAAARYQKLLDGARQRWGVGSSLGSEKAFGS